MNSLLMKSYFQIGLCRTLELHAASLQQDGHQVRGEPAVDGSVGILRVRVRAGLDRQQVRGDAERAGREEDV